MIRRIASVCKADFLRYSGKVRKLEGLSASRGIAIGPAFIFGEEALPEIPRTAIEPGETAAEWSRFEAALEASKQEILLLRDERNRDQSGILDAHLMMLSDPEFIPRIKRSLETTLVNVEAVLSDAVAEAAAMLRSTGDDYLAERAVDIEDAFARVQGNLAKRSPRVAGQARASSASTFIPPGSILVARAMRPSEALSLRDSGVAGIVLEEGGATSHVAILARSWRIPAVMGARGAVELVSDGVETILDANDGLVLVAPGNDLVSSYRARMTRIDKDLESKASSRVLSRDAPLTTACGERVNLLANIALAEEAALAIEDGAVGIGLYRSEFLFLGSRGLPHEETQFAAYRAAVELSRGAPVVVRTLDAGADKALDEQIELAEKNPLLGWRAVRFCLDRKDVFRTQLRALLRASAFGDLRIMFPMISCVEELDAALDALDEARSELAAAKVPFRKGLKVGIMIEIPAAAACADLLAKKVDFMSIGTNDLIQYTMAVDRENSRVAHLFDCYQPAVLRLIDATIRAGERTRTSVSMCGEMAHDPAAVFLLLGMGLRNFSMASERIGAVRDLVERVTLADAQELARSATCGSCFP